jgi:hypothetical protein
MSILLLLQCCPDHVAASCAAVPVASRCAILDAEEGRLPAVFTGHVFLLKYSQTLNAVYGINQIGSVKRTTLTMTISHAYSMNHKTVSMKVPVM